MPKDFDTTLSAALDLAADAARTEGAAAARVRGRKRTVRTRIAASALSAALVAGGTTAAFKIASPYDGTPRPTATNPLATASPTVHNPAATADPHQVAPDAWLSPAELPFAGVFSWKAVQADPHGISPIGQPLTATVFYVANNTPFQSLTTCADPASLLGRTIGAQHTDYTATAQGSSNTASQFVFFFANPASAQQTFNWLQNQYVATCENVKGMIPTKTVGDGRTNAAWLSVEGASGPIDASAYIREYFVVRGSTIAYVSVSTNAGGPTTTDDDDVAELSTMAAHLCVYGGLCR